jgi:hypothetical protein
MKFTRYRDRQIREVEELKLVVRQLTSIEDASCYAEKISSLEKDQINFIKLSKEQITVVKSTM